MKEKRVTTFGYSEFRGISVQKSIPGQDALQSRDFVGANEQYLIYASAGIINIFEIVLVNGKTASNATKDSNKELLDVGSKDNRLHHR